MIISIEALLDYLECPARYDYRYIQQVDTTLTNLRQVYPKFNEQSLEEAFDREIHKVGYHIFNYIQDERYPTEYLLRQKWGKLWCKDKSVENVIMETTNRDAIPIRKKLEKKGLKIISHLHPKFKEVSGVPLLVGKRARIKIGKHQLDVTIDLAREVVIEGRHHLEIMDFKSGIKTTKHNDAKPLNFHVQHDLGMTAISLAFRQLTGEKEDRLVYYDMVNDREYVVSRSEQDYQTLERVLDHVEKALEHNILYPVMNDRCFECPFQYNCRQGKWYEEKKSEEST